MRIPYELKRINPNYQSFSIATNKRRGAILLACAIFFMIIGLLYNNADWFKEFIPDCQIVQLLCSLSFFIGIILVLYFLFVSDIVFTYLSKANHRELNEIDLMEVAYQVIDSDKKTVIVIEDLDRVNNAEGLDDFIKEIATYYANSKCAFLITVTPNTLKKWRDSVKEEEGKADSEIKPFDFIVNMPPIKGTDYEVILREMLRSKKDVYKEKLGLDIEEYIDSWVWITYGDAMNIRRLKYRVNNVIHLYSTIYERFKNVRPNIKTCIAVTYLQDCYPEEFSNILTEQNGKLELQTKIEEYINSPDRIPTDNFEKQLRSLILNNYFEYNCEMYCFNYSKNNECFSTTESLLFDAFLNDTPYPSDEYLISSVTESNPKWLYNAIDKRLDAVGVMPNNVFDNPTIFDYLLKHLKKSPEKLESFYRISMSTTEYSVNQTANKIKKIANSKEFDIEEKKRYISVSCTELLNGNSVASIAYIRKQLMDCFDDLMLLKPLYSEGFAIISDEEITNLVSMQEITELVNYERINADNIKYIINRIDCVFDGENELLISFASSINKSLADYFIKNCKSLAKLKENEKLQLFENNKDKISTSNSDKIVEIIENLEYSFEDLENRLIDFANAKAIAISRFQEIVSNLPNVHKCTLDRLELDDCKLETSDVVIKAYEEENNLYGYVKFRTINEKKVPLDIKGASDVYERIYSNTSGIFDEILHFDQDFLEYIYDLEIYTKYSNSRLQLMAYYVLTEKLLQYIFEAFENHAEFDEFFSNIKEEKSREGFFKYMIRKHKDIISHLSETAYNHFHDTVRGRSKKNVLWHAYHR